MKTDTTKNYGNKSLKLENILHQVQYSLSINPILQPTKCTRIAILVWYQRMYNYLYTWRPSLEITLWPEVSPTGRFHFHGTLLLKTNKLADRIMFVDFVQSIGSCSHFEIDTISTDTADAYLQYCKKQFDWWSELFSSGHHEYPLKIKKIRLLDTVSNDESAVRSKAKPKINKFFEPSSDSSDENGSSQKPSSRSD